MSFKVSNESLLLATFPTSPASRADKQSSFLDGVHLPIVLNYLLD